MYVEKYDYVILLLVSYVQVTQNVIQKYKTLNDRKT